MNNLPEYDPRKDAFDSYNVAISAMRAKLLHERCSAAKRVEVMDSQGFPITIVGEDDRVAVYSVIDDLNGLPVYIGTTKTGIKVRMRSHVSDAISGSKLPIHEWMRQRPGGFYVRVIEYVPVEQREDRERYWISQYSTLLNVTDGGPGMSGHKFAGTEHARRIAEKIKTSGNFSCMQCSSEFYRKHSQVIKQKNKFCSRKCYQAWQRGKTKSNEKGLMGVSGRAAALEKRRAAV